MPSERSPNVANDARSQALELRRSLGEISCAECRRLKLKCDKTIPCSSCVRRGCSSICPNKIQSTHHNNRPTLSETEKLKHKVATMSKRIQQLEDALSVLQSTVSSEQHPMLACDLLDIKNTNLTFPDLTSFKSNHADRDVSTEDSIASFATLRLSDDGAAESYLLGAESFLMHKLSVRNFGLSPSQKQTQCAPDGFPEPLFRLSEHFPFDKYYVPPEEIYHSMESKLPSYARASALIETFLASIAWFFKLVSREDIYGQFLPAVYGKHPLTSAKRPPLSETHPHVTSLLFAIFAIGATSDLTQEPDNDEAMSYYYLARAALSQRSVFESANLTTVRAVILIGTYDLSSCREVSLEGTWRMVSFGQSIATSIGLHREPTRFNLPPKEVQRRRKVFWEIVSLDCWRAIGTGRPQTFHPSVIDCEFPEDDDAILDEAGNEIPGFPRMRYRFTKEVLFDVATMLNRTSSFKYSEILACDQRIREFGPAKLFEQSVEAYVKSDSGGDHARSKLHVFLLTVMKDVILLSLHRNFFGKALLEDPVNPMRSSFGPSFLSAYRSATTLMRVVKEGYTMNDKLIIRIWPMWAHSMFATIMLGFVAQLSKCTLAKQALVEFENALEFFQIAQVHPFVKTAMPIFQKMRQAAYDGLHGKGGDSSLPVPPTFRETSKSQAAQSPRPRDTPGQQNLNTLSLDTHSVNSFSPPSSSGEPSPFVTGKKVDSAPGPALFGGHNFKSSDFSPSSAVFQSSTLNLYPDLGILGAPLIPPIPMDDGSQTPSLDTILSNAAFTGFSLPPDMLGSGIPTPLDFDVSLDLQSIGGPSSILSELPSQDMDAWSSLMQDSRYFGYPDMPMTPNDSPPRT